MGLNKEYKVLLFDLDDTILSFSKAEEYALKKLFLYYNIDTTKEKVELYQKINLKYWKMLERKEIIREELLKRRFKEFFQAINFQIEEDDAYLANDIYFSYLTSKVFYIYGAIPALKVLKDKYKIYIITNGIKKVQAKRMRIAYKLHNLYDGVFVSEEIGYPKPSIEYMNKVLEKLSCKKEEILIIGDSLSSDMMLGINSNIDTCWFNQKNEKTDLNISYTVASYNQLLKLLNDSHS